MKALSKKRKHPTAQTLLVSLSKTSMVQRQALWYTIFIATYIWFMYWVAYDFFIWHKPVAELNPVNYAGAIATIAFIWAGTKLLKNNQTKTANTQRTLLQSPTQELRPSQKPKPPPTLKSTPQQKTQHQPQRTVTASPITGCARHLGYLNQREKSKEIPAECLTCEHVIQCMSGPN